MELVVDLRDLSSRDSDSTVVGPHSRFFILDTEAPVEVVGAHFKPGGAFRFLGLPAEELRNCRIGPEDLWGASTAQEVRQKLLELRDVEARMRELERFLLMNEADRWDPHPAVEWALKSFARVPHSRTMSEVADAVGLSSTRFIELFRREVGMTPRLFCRIQRFQAVVRRVERRGGEPHWADLAFECGFADQAHMIREVRTFSGYTPTQYLANRTGKLNHLLHQA